MQVFFNIFLIKFKISFYFIELFDYEAVFEYNRTVPNRELSKAGFILGWLYGHCDRNRTREVKL